MKHEAHGAKHDKLKDKLRENLLRRKEQQRSGEVRPKEKAADVRPC